MSDSDFKNGHYLPLSRRKLIDTVPRLQATDLPVFRMR
jgi:hypothetical protein